MSPPDRLKPPSPSTLWMAAATACLLLALLFSIRPIAELDVGYHLKAGEWILGHLAVPRLDPFTYTVATHEYIDLHWLYQVVLFLIWKAGGYTSISLFTAVVILAVFALTLLRIRNLGTPAWTALPVLLAAVMASSFRFMVRPEGLTWLYLTLVLLLLERDASGKKAPLWLIPLLHVLWVNTQGLFILGWIVLGSYALSALVHDRPRAPRLFKLLGLSILACLLSPYGVKGLMFPLTLFTRLSGASVFKHTIREFISPWARQGSDAEPFAPYTVLYTYRIFSVAFFLLLALTLRRRKLHDFLVPAAFFYLSAIGIRNVPLFMLAATPVAAKALGDLPRIHAGLQGPMERLASSRIGSLASILFVLAMGLRVVTNAWYVADRSEIHFALGLDPVSLPVRAAEFLRERMPGAQLLNHLNTGGWLDWRFPGKTFIDGRLEVIGEDFYKTYLAASRPGGLKTLADRYGADTIVYAYQEAPNWTSQMEQDPAWKLVFFDETSAVYARTAVYPGIPPTTPEAFLKERGIPLLTPQQAETAWSLPVPGKLKVFFDGFHRRAFYPNGLFRAAYYCLQTKRFGAAEALYAESNRLAGGRLYEIYFNAAYTYSVSDRPDLARTCLRKALRLNPHHPMLRALAAKLNLAPTH